MDDKRQKNQLELAFMVERKGEARKPAEKGTELSLAKYESESLVESKRLMEAVCEPKNLKQALRRVKGNGGSPGIDGMKTDELPRWLIENWAKLRENLLTGRHQAQPVRRVEIDKPDGGKRQLGIPTVIDRLVQQAVLQILQKIWDPTFSESSYGFRKQRSPHQAVETAQRYLAEGRGWVVDIDLEKFFDRVHHDRLMARLETRTSDKRMLKLVRGFLTAGVLEGGLCSPTNEGTPQGGPLSPLLSNIVLDELDKELEKRGHKFARYADDCNIYVRSERAGKRVMESLGLFITTRLRLRINERKSAVARPHERQFLGFSFTRKGEPRRKVAPKALLRFKKRIREITRRTRGRKLSDIVQELNLYMTGWYGYFGFCETRSDLKKLDEWIRRRLRAYTWKQWRTFANRRKKLLQRRVNHDEATTLAISQKGPWRLSLAPALIKAMPNVFFVSIGLFRLWQTA